MQDVKMIEQPAVRENAVHETGRHISLYCCIDHSAIQPLKAASVLNQFSNSSIVIECKKNLLQLFLGFSL